MDDGRIHMRVHGVAISSLLLLLLLKSIAVTRTIKTDLFTGIYEIQNLLNEPANGEPTARRLCSLVICVFCLIVHQIGIENIEIEKKMETRKYTNASDTNACSGFGTLAFELPRIFYLI